MLDLLIGPLDYEFFRRALLGGLLVGAICAVVGTYVVLRGLAFIGDALAHAAFPGVVIAYLLKANIYVGAALFTVATALGIGFLSRRARTSYDTTIGILFAGAFALGILLMSTIDGYTADLFSFLFGNILGMSTADLWVAGGLVTVVLLAVLLCYKELLLRSFDPVVAEAMGYPVHASRLPPAVLGSGHDRGGDSSRRHRAGRGLAGNPKRHGVPPDRAVLSDDGPRRACLGRRDRARSLPLLLSQRRIRGRYRPGQHRSLLRDARLSTASGKPRPALLIPSRQIAARAKASAGARLAAPARTLLRDLSPIRSACLPPIPPLGTQGPRLAEHLLAAELPDRAREPFQVRLVWREGRPRNHRQLLRDVAHRLPPQAIQLRSLQTYGNRQRFPQARDAPRRTLAFPDQHLQRS